ncbi:MAG: mercury methylation corrinoid protein HgcA [Leptospirales bacterium]
MFQPIKSQTLPDFSGLGSTVGATANSGPGQNYVLNPPKKITQNSPKPLPRVDHKWNVRDYLGAFLARTTSRRNDYTVFPGLYRFGEADKDSEVLVSANYKLTFDKLRQKLEGRNVWILVLDTKGINVWCAAGKGTFGTTELIKKIQAVNLGEVVKHRRVIVPQLGAVGMAAHEIKLRTGFRVSYGPVDARDLPEYLDNARRTTPQMRRVRFNWRDRLVLTPMEIIPSFKHFWKYTAIIAILFGVQREGILFQNIIQDGGAYIFAGVSALFAGALMTPLLLPLMPFRSFALKGFIAGVAVCAALFGISQYQESSFFWSNNPWFLAFAFIFIPSASSFLALQFTGSSTFTNMTGVYKEHKYALPLYIVAVVLSVILALAHKVTLWMNAGGSL